MAQSQPINGTDILAIVAALPEAARMSLIVDMVQCPRGSPIVWSDFAIDALSPLDRAIDNAWPRMSAVIGGAA